MKYKAIIVLLYFGVFVIHQSSGEDQDVIEGKDNSLDQSSLEVTTAIGEPENTTVDDTFTKQQTDVKEDTFPDKEVLIDSKTDVNAEGKEANDDDHKLLDRNSLDVTPISNDIQNTTGASIEKEDQLIDEEDDHRSQDENSIDDATTISEEPITTSTEFTTIAVQQSNVTGDQLVDEEKHHETQDRHSLDATSITLGANETESANTPPKNPCEHYDPTPPDFRAPGRRISEAKCYEYVWRLREREVKAQREYDCDMLQKSVVNYIIGGDYTEPGDHPNMGAIGWQTINGTYRFLCGSSLISSKFILTAAHCTQSPPEPLINDTVPKIVRFGVKNIQDSVSWAVDVNITRIISHPDYKAPKQYFDIALMELEERVEFTSDVQPACLWGNKDFHLNSGQAEVAGWGVVDSKTKRTSSELLAAKVDIIDFKKCGNLLRRSCNRNFCGLQDHQLCAGKLGGGVDACQGDSGGPLQVKIPLPTESQGAMHYVIGVTSFGIGCALPGLPGVYTKVSSFIDWIEDNVWPDNTY